MGCGLDGCHGPSLAYEAAAEISSKSSSKEESLGTLVAANRTVIIDLLKTHLGGRREQLGYLQEEMAGLELEISGLESALFSLENIGL